MKYIKNVKCEIEEYDEEGTQYFTDLSAPTIEMVIEKMGAYERAQENQKGMAEAHAELNAELAAEDARDIKEEMAKSRNEELEEQMAYEKKANSYKSSELVADGLAKLEE